MQLYQVNLDGKTAFTIALWAKVFAYNEWAGVVLCRNDVTRCVIGMTLWAAGSDLVMFRLQQSATDSLGIGAKIRLNEWYFIAGTWDGSRDGVLRLYMNGRLAGTSSGSYKGTLSQSAAFEAGASISGQGTFTKYFMNGLIDEVTFWDRALTAKEIEQLYNDYSLFYPVRFQVRSAPTVAELASRNFVGPDGTSSSFYYGRREPLVGSTDFALTNRYAQYRAYLFSSSDQKEAPVIQAVGLFAAESGETDDTWTDFRFGEFTSNTTNSPIGSIRGYLGLGKALNGGYYTNGVFVSRVLENPTGPVTWDRIEWTVAGEELDVFTPGLAGLYHCRNTWADATGQRSGNPSPGVAYSDLAKLGGKCAVFNGTSAYVDGFGFGTIQSIEFWIQNDHRDNPILTVDTGTAIWIRNHCVTAEGFGSAMPTIYVNGSSTSARLIPGWNHVVLVWRSPVTAGAFTVGRVGSEYMEGMIDEMAVYNRTLPSTEVREHYERGRRRIAGQVRFQARASNDPTFAGVPFVGPGGNPTSYYLGNSALSSASGRYFQYRAVLDGDGASTPGVMNVTVFYDNLTKTYVDDTPEEFYNGTFVGGTTAYYGDEMNLEDQTALGPGNMPRVAYPTLIGLWHLDEENWGTVRDEVGGGDGVADGSAYPVPEARVGLRCGWFSGVDGRVVLGSPAVGAFPFSVSLWFRTKSSTRSALISSFVGTGPFFALEVNSDGTGLSAGRVAFVIDDASSGRKVAASTRTGLNDDQWHNVIGIRNNNQILIYVDGVLEGATYIGVSYGDIGGSAPMLAYNGAGTFFGGYIDEVAIFAHPLTLAQIGEISGVGVKTRDTGIFIGQTITVRDPTIWQKLVWPIHGSYQNALVPDASVIGLWHLDETAGGVARDSSPNANHGTVVGLQGTAGRLGRCVKFNGVNNAITILSPVGLAPTRITVEAWVNMDDVAGRTILDRRSGGAGYALYTEADGRLTFWIGTGSGNVTATTPLPIRSGVWTHVAGTFDGRNVDTYVNGQREARTVLLGSASLGGGTLIIGSNVGGGNWLAGLIDEVAIHSRALLP
ncbi:MAG: LamG domain-containing protein, partial [Kiritimatiellae bacterium]|nr:LamG domain-containing protein [Kiritimatiellia bacterium]